MATKRIRFISAWNTWLGLYKSSRNARTEAAIPLRARGLLEFRMDFLSRGDRKRIVKSIEKGYTTARAPSWVQSMHFLLTAAQAGFEVSYFGRSKGKLWFPTVKAAMDAHKLIEAQLTMTQDFHPSYIKRRENRLHIDLYSRTTPGQFNSLKVLVSQLYEEDAAIREKFAAKIQEPDFRIAVAFDSMPDGMISR